MKNNAQKTAFQRAYSRWFAEYDQARRQHKRRMGASVPGLPPPPIGPEEIGEALDRVGREFFRSIIGVHRSTLARWQTGAAVMPRSAWLLLVLLDQGRLPGMSSDWRDFRFCGDRLHLIGTRISYTAREIAGWHYQTAHAAALARRVAELEKQTAYLLRVGRFESANDPLMVATGCHP